MIDPKDPRLVLNAWVVYKRPEMDRGQDGYVSSLQARPRYIHVRFGNQPQGQACDPRELSWPVPQSADLVEDPRVCDGCGRFNEECSCS